MIKRISRKAKATAITIVLLSLWSSLGLAVGGITADSDGPYYATSANQEDFEDMRVKVLGGYVRMTRRWMGDHWEWNSRWNDLKNTADEPVYRYVNDSYGNPVLLSNVFPQAFCDGLCAGGSKLVPVAIVRNRRAYIGVSDMYAPGATMDNRLRFTIEGGLGGFVWRDRQGNSATYDTYGRMEYYIDRNGINVSVVRNENNDISAVIDHHGNTVITFHWDLVPGTDNRVDEQSNPLPADYRLKKLIDYSGREVVYHYDDDLDGMLTQVTDVRGEQWAYQYDDKKLVSQTDPDNRVTSYGIDSDGTLRSRLNADGVGSNYSYSYDSGKEEYYISVVDSAGTVTESWYDALGAEVRRDINGETQFSAEVVPSTGGVGVYDIRKRYVVSPYSLTSTLDVNGEDAEDPSDFSDIIEPDLLLPAPVWVDTKTVTDARGNKTRYSYDQFGNTLSIERPDGTKVITTYEPNLSIPSTTINEKGLLTEYKYYDGGNLKDLTEAKGTGAERTTSYTYDAFGQRKTMTTGASTVGDTALATTEWFYDDYGNVTKVIDPGARETVYSNFDVLGNAWTVTDARTYIWQKTFDEVGNLLTDLNPYAQGETYTYTKAGDLHTISGANASVTTLTTNASGLPKTITDQENAVTELEYDKANRPTAIIDANGNSNQRGYDEQGRLKSVTDGEENTTTYVYANTLLDSIHYPTYEETLSYDNRNRLKTSIQDANNTSYLRQYGYDLTNNLDDSTDAEGNKEDYLYDELDRLTHVIDADTGDTEFTYDARDNLRQVKDPEGRLTVYSYNLNDELGTETKHDFFLEGGAGTAKQRSYGYDKNGNLSSVINPEQEKTKNSYDNANRLETSEIFAHKDDADPIKVISYGYNTKNQYEGYSQVAGAATAGQTADILPLSEAYTYNTLNQLESVVVNFGAFSKTYSYTYYPNGLKQTYTNPEGIVYTYYYNKNNQIAAVHIPGKGQLSWTDFQWLVPQTLVLPGGSKITLSYDDFLRVEERILKDAANDDLASAIYQYDLESNIKNIATEHGDYVFGYDQLYRLETADYPEAVAANDEAFDYDGVGNRTKQADGLDINQSPETSSYNNHNQLSSIDSSVTFTYNDNGHTETKVESNDGATKSTEYVYNREERLIAVKVDGVTVGEYVYNPYGQRVRKIAGGVTTWFLYNDEGMAAEYDAAGALVKEYHFKPYSTWMTEPLFQRAADGEVYYYQNDHLGTPQRLVGANGGVVWEARYSAFGEASVWVETVGNNLRFPGQYFDSESGLHHNYFRDYDSGLGRYVQEDPIGLWGGWNTYGYAGGNGVSRIDPDGQAWWVVGEIVKAIAQQIGCNEVGDRYDDWNDTVDEIRDDKLDRLEEQQSEYFRNCQRKYDDSCARKKCQSENPYNDPDKVNKIFDDANRDKENNPWRYLNDVCNALSDQVPKPKRPKPTPKPDWRGYEDGRPW